MKLVCFTLGADDTLRPGALLGSGDFILDFAASAADVPRGRSMLDWCDLAGRSLPAAKALAARVSGDAALRAGLERAGAIVKRSAAKLLAPIPRPGKVICIGLNYRDHAKESGMAIPSRPLVFSKFSSCVVGPGATVVRPIGCTQLDYEAELGFVVGRRATRVKAADAMEHVLGYVNINDVSARDFQFADGQWQRGKSSDTFCPMGEYIATTDEIADPHKLRIRLRLNGQTMQDSSTEQLIFGIPQLIEALTEFVTLEPGDVIATGTPFGVGFARKPPVYVQPGDVMEVEIDGLGVLRNPVADAL